jgi:hypothetical protein
MMIEIEQDPKVQALRVFHVCDLGESGKTHCNIPCRQLHRMVLSLLFEAVYFADVPTITRMTQLPPGFTHELNQHLFEQEPPVDERTGGPIVDLEHFCCGASKFSCL